MQAIRMPSEGQRFILAESTYEVTSSRGTRFKAVLLKGEPVTQKYKFSLLGTKFWVVKEGRRILVDVR